MLLSPTNTTNLAPNNYILLKDQPVGVLPVNYKSRNSPVKNGHGELETVTTFMYYTLLSVDRAAFFDNYLCEHKCFNLHYCNPLYEYSAPDFQLSHIKF